MNGQRMKISQHRRLGKYGYFAVIKGFGSLGRG
jgi:hypothetical protein